MQLMLHLIILKNGNNVYFRALFTVLPISYINVSWYVRTGDLFCTSVCLELQIERSKTQRVSKANHVGCTKLLRDGYGTVSGYSANTNPGNRVPKLVYV